MEVSEVVEFFGGIQPTAERLGVTRQTIHAWTKTGYFPPLRALQIHHESAGKLVLADLPIPPETDSAA